jgi:3-hydroxybutyryl-CoA dehydrogenase
VRLRAVRKLWGAHAGMSSTRASQGQSVVVVGGGAMGTGIAYSAAFAQYQVTVVEPVSTQYERLMRAVGQAARDAVRRGKLDEAGAAALSARITRVGGIADIPKRPDVAIETVSENLDLKLRILRELGALEPRLIGTNTSALSIDELAAALPDPSRFLGIHFFQPVWSFKFVELIRGKVTAAASVAAAQAFATSLGKESIVVRNVPGFATSRLDVISSLEAMRMLEDGVASAEDIDRASMLAFHHPIGPLRLSDMVGLDVRLDIARVLERTYGPRYTPPRILEAMVARGELGRKSGRGFFVWAGEGV